MSYTRIFNFCHDITAGEKIKDFSVCGHSCGQSRFCAVFGNRGKTAIARVARLCGVSHCPVPDTATALPKQARYQLRYTRLFSLFIRLVVFSQIKRDTNFAIPGDLLSIAQLWVEGKRKFLVYINKVVIGGRLPADDDLIQICIKHLACCALRQREGDIRAEKVGVDGQVEAAAL